MTAYLGLQDLLQAAQANADYDVQVRDYGLLQSALQRPAASVFTEDAYPSLHLKAAALLQSLARNHALLDGNKRAALDALAVFYYWNGYRLTLAEPQAADFVVDVAEGKLNDVDDVAAGLRAIATFEQVQP